MKTLSSIPSSAKKKKAKTLHMQARGWGGSLVADALPGMREALGCIPDPKLKFELFSDNAQICLPSSKPHVWPANCRSLPSKLPGAPETPHGAAAHRPAPLPTASLSPG